MEQKQPKRCLMTTTNVPESLIMEDILTKLPVKSLLRFKTVCKSWQSTINGSRLLITHLLTNEFKFMEDETLVIENINSMNLEELRDSDLYGSCNGLIFGGREEKKFYVCNPATREYRELPKPSIDIILDFGFAYDEAIDDYKVILISWARANELSICCCCSLKL
ncbi:hypothetical protein JCGZ_00728 [Jatropha curcas]|uniref:F-box domain-containing protein n=1 Tax=Jatropha curcas TaxID=180498 RepID=A0A067KRW9_JATCU|nr:hypothetical protein JCGZ_00728 [Jatropha curcas]